MGVLDDYKLHFEKLPSETKNLLKNPHLRAAAYRFYKESVRLADEAEKHTARWRIFKRLGRIEDQVDKPFLYDSGLLSRIESLEAHIEKLPKPRRKATK